MGRGYDPKKWWFLEFSSHLFSFLMICHYFLLAYSVNLPPLQCPHSDVERRRRSRSRQIKKGDFTDSQKRTRAAYQACCFHYFPCILSHGAFDDDRNDAHCSVSRAYFYACRMKTTPVNWRCCSQSSEEDGVYFVQSSSRQFGRRLICASSRMEGVCLSILRRILKKTVWSRPSKRLIARWKVVDYRDWSIA